MKSLDMGKYKFEKSKWSYKMPGVRRPQSIRGGHIDDGKLYFVLMHDYKGFTKSHLIAIDLLNKKERMVFDVEHVAGKPLIEGDKIFITTYEPKLYCIDKNSHAIVWVWDDSIIKSNMNAYIGKSHTNIMVSEFAGIGRYVYCIDEIAQQAKWCYDCRTSVSSEFYIEGNKVFFGTNGAGAVCLSIDNGNVVWAEDAELRCPTTGHPSEKSIYTKLVRNLSLTELLVMDSVATLRVLDKSTGATLNGIPFPPNSILGMEIFGACIYVSVENEGLICLNYTKNKELEKLWGFCPGEITSGGFCIFEENVVYSCGDGKNNNIYLLDKNNGSELANVKSKNLIRSFVRNELDFYLLSDKGQVELISIVENL